MRHSPSHFRAAALRIRLRPPCKRLRPLCKTLRPLCKPLRPLLDARRGSPVATRPIPASHARPGRIHGPRRTGALGLVALLFASAIASPALASAADPSAEAASSWTLARQEQGIDVYTRPVAGSDVKAFRGEALVEASVDDVLAILRDGDRLHEWFPNCPESKLLSREGDVTYQYTVMSAPWPVDDRDNVFRSVLARDEKTGVVEIDLTAAPDFHPEQEDRVRVRLADGAWRLEPLPGDRTRVVFTMHLDPGGGVPAWMANTRVLTTPFEAIRNLRERLGG